MWRSRSGGEPKGIPKIIVPDERPSQGNMLINNTANNAFQPGMEGLRRSKQNRDVKDSSSGSMILSLFRRLKPGSKPCMDSYSDQLLIYCVSGRFSAREGLERREGEKTQQQGCRCPPSHHFLQQ